MPLSNNDHFGKVACILVIRKVATEMTGVRATGAALKEKVDSE